MTNDKGARKAIPISTGVLDYFPRAIAAIAHLSQVGNDQHNPGEHLHWAREKSQDQVDCALRHHLERGITDDDSVLHSTKAAWRFLAALEIELEYRNGQCDFEFLATSLGLPAAQRIHDEMMAEAETAVEEFATVAPIADHAEDAIAYMREMCDPKTFEDERAEEAWNVGNIQSAQNVPPIESLDKHQTPSNGALETLEKVCKGYVEVIESRATRLDDEIDFLVAIESVDPVMGNSIVEVYSYVVPNLFPDQIFHRVEKFAQERAREVAARNRFNETLKASSEIERDVLQVFDIDIEGLHTLDIQGRTGKAHVHLLLPPSSAICGQSGFKVLHNHATADGRNYVVYEVCLETLNRAAAEKRDTGDCEFSPFRHTPKAMGSTKLPAMPSPTQDILRGAIPRE